MNRSKKNLFIEAYGMEYLPKLDPAIGGCGFPLMRVHWRLVELQDEIGEDVLSCWLFDTFDNRIPLINCLKEVHELNTSPRIQVSLPRLIYQEHDMILRDHYAALTEKKRAHVDSIEILVHDDHVQIVAKEIGKFPWDLDKPENVAVPDDPDNGMHVYPADGIPGYSLLTGWMD